MIYQLILADNGDLLAEGQMAELAVMQAKLKAEGKKTSLIRKDDGLVILG